MLTIYVMEIKKVVVSHEKIFDTQRFHLVVSDIYIVIGKQTKLNQSSQKTISR